MANIIFITGASGVGKTTLTEILKSRLPKNSFDIHDLDERGVSDNVAEEQIRLRLNKRYTDPKHVEDLRRVIGDSPEGFIGFAVESAKEFREAAKKFSASILDTTPLNPDEVAAKIEEVIKGF